MQKHHEKRMLKEPLSKEAPNISRPVWGTLNKTCKECSYNDQDIDTFPCAKCHTRH